jgi:hypothetical protein
MTEFSAQQPLAFLPHLSLGYMFSLPQTSAL